VPEIPSSARVKKRVVLHFPGFEPLDAERHRVRYERAMQRTAELWGLEADVGALNQEDGRAYFDVETSRAADGFRTSSRFFVFDHAAIVDRLAARPLAKRLVQGFRSAAAVVMEGGAFGYFRHAWRFGLFFIFPFLLVALGMAVSFALATYPLWLGGGLLQFPIGIALGFFFFVRMFIPWSDRFHTLHLFSDWDMAVAVSRLDKAEVNDWIEASAQAARQAFDLQADEYVISSHSMGSSMAAQTIGLLLEREPDLLDGKRVVFVTLGGATLQCALLRSASVLRARIGLIARSSNVTWLEIQCLTDVISFYRSSVTALTGHPDAPQPRLVFLRIKNMLFAERYKRIKLDFLRVHRQYVLASDRRSNFDFGLMTAGPLAASSFTHFSGEWAHDAELDYPQRAVGGAAR
jgi:hypothetical protein